MTDISKYEVLNFVMLCICVCLLLAILLWLALCQVCSCVEGDRNVVVPGIVMGRGVDNLSFYEEKINKCSDREMILSLTC
jgi:hypothetical protein